MGEMRRLLLYSLSRSRSTTLCRHPANGVCAGQGIATAGEGLRGVCFNFINRFLREKAFGIMGKTKIIGAADKKVCAGLFRQILLHVKATGEGHQHIQKHHGQRKGDPHKNGLTLVPPQIGKGRLVNRGAAGGTALFLGLHHFRVLRRFHGRNLCGNSPGTGAGQQHRDQGKKSVCLSTIQTLPWESFHILSRI